MKFLPALLLLAAYLPVAAQKQKPAHAVIEMTTTDFTTMKNINGLNLSFYGLRAGLTKAEAVARLGTLKQFTWDYDAFNTKSKDASSLEEMRIYVKLADGLPAGDATVLYLIWNKGAKGMSSIVFFTPAETFVAGNVKKLFTAEAMQPGSGIISFLNDKPAVSTTSYGVSTWTFKKQHFKMISVEGNNKTDVYFGVE